MNNISKTTFLKYLRCPRAAGFESKTGELIHNYKLDLNKADNEQKTHLLELDIKEKLKDLFSDMLKDDEAEESDGEEYAATDFDNLIKENKALSAMMNTYFQIEELSTAKARTLFGGLIIAGRREGNQVLGQKIINLFKDGFNFYSFIDTYQEDEQNIRIIESKSTTSSKFLDLGPSVKKEKQPIFVTSPQGVLYLKEEVGNFELDEKYFEHRNKLLDRFSAVGGYVYDLAWQRYIIEHSEPTNKKRRYYLSVLNRDYKCDGKKDQDGRNLYNPEAIVTFIDLTQITAELQTSIEADFNTLIERITHPDTSIVPLENRKCQIGKGYHECPWIKICKKDKKVPDKNSVYVYLDGHKGFGDQDMKADEKESREDLIERGITGALDVTYEWLSPKQQIQYRTIFNGKPFIEKEFIRSMLNDLRYPLFHLDFETMNYPLPKFRQEAPYQQSVFQFSLHVERAPGLSDKETDNYSFLSQGKEDDREKLIQALIKHIPASENGTVIVYNQSFEKSRLKELAEMFPKYREDLESIRERIIDLMHFLKPNKQIIESKSVLKHDGGGLLYYHVDLQRSYSIKKVLPIFAPHLNYANLDEVHNGIEAQVAFMKLSTLDGDDYDKTYRNMIEYCKQDTWAMVEILKGLRELVK
ncbi:MAG: DUF2779 domain-containing protein [Bacilli bacterium]